MSQVNPIRRGPDNIPGPSKAKGGNSPSEATAAKVSKIAQMPNLDLQEGLRGRQVTPLHAANDLSKRIQRDWNFLEPEVLAERIIELEDRVALLKESSPAVDKIKKQAEHLHFQFVFPVALELDVATSGKGMPLSFARTVYSAAKQVFQTNSVHAFNRLSPTQKREVMRFAAKGVVL